MQIIFMIDNLFSRGPAVEVKVSILLSLCQNPSILGHELYIFVRRGAFSEGTYHSEDSCRFQLKCFLPTSLFLVLLGVLHLVS